MGLPGYYITDPSALVAFPVSFGFDSLKGHEEGDLAFETERGKRWVYKQFTRRTLKLQFRLTDSQLAIFETLHQAVQGQAIPFYFVPDVNASPLDALYVRKEQNFTPARATGMEQDGTVGRFWEYLLELSAEVTGAA